MSIRDLAAHSARFVTVAELAEYWAVSRRQIYKCIDSGALDALCFGSRLYRIRTSKALEYERIASIGLATGAEANPNRSVIRAPQGARLPEKIGLRRVPGKAGSG